MYGWFKLLKENESAMIIGYSGAKDKSCNGRLIYNKKAEYMNINKLSANATKNETIHLIYPIMGRVLQGVEVGKLGMVATG